MFSRYFRHRCLLAHMMRVRVFANYFVASLKQYRGHVCNFISIFTILNFNYNSECHKSYILLPINSHTPIFDL